MILRDAIAREIMLAFAPNAHAEDAPLAHEVALADAIVALVARDIAALPTHSPLGSAYGTLDWRRMVLALVRGEAGA